MVESYLQKLISLTKINDLLHPNPIYKCVIFLLGLLFELPAQLFLSSSSLVLIFHHHHHLKEIRNCDHLILSKKKRTLTGNTVFKISNMSYPKVHDNTTICNKVCQWIATGWWCSLGNPDYSTIKTDRHVITEILLKVVLNTITLKYMN